MSAITHHQLKYNRINFYLRDAIIGWAVRRWGHLETGG